MPLATKNNAIIVKDGNLAENCGCCGGWYCCADKGCVLDGIASASVQITAQDYLRWSFAQINSSTTAYNSDSFLGSFFAGNHTLTKSTNPLIGWSKTFSDYISLPGGTAPPPATVSLRKAYWPETANEMMMLTFSWSFFARELYAEEYRNPYQWQDVPGGYMGFQPMSRSVVVACPSFSGSASMTFEAVLRPLYGWASTLTPPTIVSETGSKSVTISVVWS